MNYATIENAPRYADTFNDVYLYLFEHRASNHPWPSWTGVLHGDEIAFIFGEPFNNTYGYNQKERQLSREMMTYWTNFAKTGYVMPSFIMIQGIIGVLQCDKIRGIIYQQLLPEKNARSLVK